MTKSIETLINDIHDVIRSKKDGWFTDQLSSELSSDLASRLSLSLGGNTHKPTLRMSQMGPKCPRALWYSIHHPELAEPLPPWAEVKFAFGHVIEALAITLAKAAGHEVVGEQDELHLDGITGHRDCIIDGCIVDVKSAATQSFNTYKSSGLEGRDSFGYLDQLDCYLLASRDDDRVRFKNKGYLFFVDKQLGHMHLLPHEVTHEREGTLKARIAEYKQIVAEASPPPCTCGTVVDEYTRNTRLDLRASYSPYKHICFPGLRTAIYAGDRGGKPVYFSKVVKWPRNKFGLVKEVDKNGKTVYH